MDDLLAQMQQISKMGGLQKLAGMIPGLERAVAQQGGAGFDEYADGSHGGHDPLHDQGGAREVPR